jgi:hypothetical protein
MVGEQWHEDIHMSIVWDEQTLPKLINFYIVSWLYIWTFISLRIMQVDDGIKHKLG